MLDANALILDEQQLKLHFKKFNALLAPVWSPLQLAIQYGRDAG